MAREQGAEVIDFNHEDPIEAIKGLTNGIGVGRAIDAVGVDAVQAHRGPAATQSKKMRAQFEKELKEVAPEQNPQDGNWEPGDAPSQALIWGVEALAKAGTLSIVGVYSEQSNRFPIGVAMNKNLTLKMGNCNHRKYLPYLIDLVLSGRLDPANVLTQIEPMMSVIDAYKAFDQRQPGRMKVKLVPAQEENLAA